MRRRSPCPPPLSPSVRRAPETGSFPSRYRSGRRRRRRWRRARRRRWSAAATSSSVPLLFKYIQVLSITDRALWQTLSMSHNWSLSTLILQQNQVTIGFSFFFRKGHCEFFDSLGKDIEDYSSKLMKFVHKFTNDIIYSDERIQPEKTSVCGHYCLFYAYHSCKGLKMSEVLELFYKMTCQEIIDFVYKHFPLHPPSKKSYQIIANKGRNITNFPKFHLRKSAEIR